MGEFTNKDVKQMTVIEFYALINQRLKVAKRQDQHVLALGLVVRFA